MNPNEETNSGIKRDEKGHFVQGTAPGPGRPVGKTLKEYQAEIFRTMSDEEKKEWLKDMPKSERWRMAEGNPKNDMELSGGLTISQVLDELEYE